MKDSTLHFIDNSLNQNISGRNYDLLISETDSTNQLTNLKLTKIPEPVYNDWVFFIFIGVIVLMIYLNSFLKKPSVWIFDIYRNMRSIERRFRDKESLSPQELAILYVVMLVMMGLFLFFIDKEYSLKMIKKYDFNKLMLFISGIFIYLLAYDLLVFFLGWLIEKKKEVNRYIFGNRIAYFSLGLMLIPLNILICYNRVIPHNLLINIGFMLFAMTLILRVVRGFEILRNNRVFYFYQITYLCTLEIMPVILLIVFYNVLISN